MGVDNVDKFFFHTFNFIPQFKLIKYLNIKKNGNVCQSEFFKNLTNHGTFIT